jgi:unsaturated rhamnogalacturonyl hydrolase
VQQRDVQRLERVKGALLAMPRKSWEQGVAGQAFLELGDGDTLLRLATEAVQRQTADGRLAVAAEDDLSATDPAANGEPVLRAAQRTGDPALARAAARMLDFLASTARRSGDGVIFHRLDGDEIWIDSAYMAPPFLAVSGRAGDALAQIDGYRRRLWDAERSLFSHQWDERARRAKRPDFWGVGNGWAAAGLVRVAAALDPGRGDARRRLAGYAREVIDGCLAYARPDGLFHDVVDKPETFVETNLSQMLAYAMYRGVQHGWLPASPYGERADRLRAAAIAKVDAGGLVRDVCGAPTFDRPGVAVEGQAFHLLMEAAARDAGAA